MVKLWKSKALACAAVVLLSAPVNAQNCSEILNHGIWQTWERGVHSTESSDFSNWACSNSSGDGGFAFTTPKLTTMRGVVIVHEVAGLTT